MPVELDEAYDEHGKTIITEIDDDQIAFVCVQFLKRYLMMRHDFCFNKVANYKNNFTDDNERYVIEIALSVLDKELSK